MKPLIGLVADVQAGGKHTMHTVHQKYLDAVAAGASAIPVILPARIEQPGSAWTDAADLPQMLAELDGLFLTGAVSNIAPEYYGGVLEDPASPGDRARDQVSLTLVAEAVRIGLPVLGVCRGFQEINVALGGTLHQAVHRTPGLDDHRENGSLSVADQYAPAHEVAFTPGGMLHLFTGQDKARVNSLHGQGVDELAPPLAVEAVAPDGLVEAFRLDGSDAYLLGVQWHPEWQFRDDPLSVVIFRSFGTAARAYRSNRRHRERLREAVA